jgi:hypothetical protein
MSALGLSPTVPPHSGAGRGQDGARPVATSGSLAARLTSGPAASVTPSPLARPAEAAVGLPEGNAETTCPSCGAPIKSNNAFCGKCGHRLKETSGLPASTTPSPVAARAAAVPRTMFMAAPIKQTTPRGHLTLIRPDGTEGGMHPLVDGENLIGRGQGSLFDADPYLSPRHAEFILDPQGLTVRDLRSLNGVFMKLGEEEPLESGSVFRIGQELLRFDVISPPQPLEDGTEIIGTPNPGYWGRISVIVGRDVDGPAFPIFEESIVLGRERGDILFPEDGYVSATHARISLRDGNVFLQDLGSSNGTFIRIRDSRFVTAGNLLLMGQQLFRVGYK